MDEIKILFDAIEKAIARFQGKVPGIQGNLLSEIETLTSKLEVKNGRISNNLANMRVLKQIQVRLQKVIISPEYKKAIQEFVKSFDTVQQLQNNYFASLAINVPTGQLLTEMKAQAIDATLTYLTEAGINSNVLQPVKDIIRQNITAGGSMKDFNKQIRSFIISDKSGNGALERYTGQITTDAINQYSRQYMNAVTEDAGMEWYMYVGSLLETSRPWCEHMVAKQYVHKSELATVVNDNINGVGICTTAIPCSRKTDLPNGMVPGTNAFTVLIYAGGYNCGHKFIPVLELAVPEAIRMKVYSSSTYKLWKNAA